MDDGSLMRRESKLDADQRAAVTRLGLDPFDLSGETHRMHALQLADPKAAEVFDPKAWERIKNRAGDIPWIENITIDKSLEFLNYMNDGYFVVQGNWTVVPAADRKVTIKGMRNTSGSIVFSGTGPVGGTLVRVLDGHFVNGNVQFATDAIRGEIVGNLFENGHVRVNLGNVVGNQITTTGGAECIRVSPSTTQFQGVTCAVIGNVLSASAAGGTWEGILVIGRAQAYHIRNNWINTAGSASKCRAAPPKAWPTSSPTTASAAARAARARATASTSPTPRTARCGR